MQTPETSPLTSLEEQRINDLKRKREQEGNESSKKRKIYKVNRSKLKRGKKQDAFPIQLQVMIF